MMSKVKIVLFIFFLATVSFSVQAFAKDSKPVLKGINVSNVGILSYDPSFMEERSDIPFKNVVDEEYIKLLGDTIDYEQFRPTLIFFEESFQPSLPGDPRKQIGNIVVTANYGKYRFPKDLTEEQKKALENDIRQNAEFNLKGTQYQIKKWMPFEFTRINGLFAISYSYEQTLGGKNPSVIKAASLYDNDVFLNIVLSAPKKEMKKWIPHFNSMVTSFVRTANIANQAVVTYPTSINNRNDIPFKYLVDSEYRNVLGDSIDYEQFRPGLLFLDRNFEIKDSLNIAPFGSLSMNVIPDQNNKVPDLSAIDIDALKQNIMGEVQANIEPTDYVIIRWGDFRLNEIKGLPALEYSYQQQKPGKDPVEVYVTNIFEKSMQIQIIASSPASGVNNWKTIYDDLLSSYQRLSYIPSVGTIIYPSELEERNDIPLIKLIDDESKKKIGENIDYEQFRPASIFLTKHFNENDSIQLQNFGSITISNKRGAFDMLKDAMPSQLDSVQNNIEELVTRNLAGTDYKVRNWNCFNVRYNSGYTLVSYEYTQQIDGQEPKCLDTTLIITPTSQTQIQLTCKDDEYSFWKAQYDAMVQSFRLEGKR